MASEYDKNLRHINTNKRNLLIGLIKTRFEETVYDYLEESNFSSMEELDNWLDSNMRDMFSQLRQIDEYYMPKIEEEEDS